MSSLQQAYLFEITLVSALVDKFNNICVKLEQLTAMPTNNIVVNACSSSQPQHVKNSSTQTDPRHSIQSTELQSEPGCQQHADDGDDDGQHPGGGLDLSTNSL